MSSSRVFAFCGLLCVLMLFHVSDGLGQSIGCPEINVSGPSSTQRCLADGSAGRKDVWSAPSLYAGWMTTPDGIHLGYDGLVPPGACVSSFFVYPLNGIELGGSLPIRLADRYAARVYGSYFITDNPQAGQDLTWTDNPPGTREWQRSRSQWYKLGGEALYPTSEGAALIGGFRWESLLTNFSDPNPNYFFTIPTMNAQTTVSFYEPYVGVSIRQGSGPGSLSVRFVGFPVLLATIEHLNVCNNNGVPFAHTGRQTAHKGFFAELSAEYCVGLFQGLEAAVFVDWNVYQGRCPMTIDRHEGGANPNVTSATVAWSHHISSLVIGARVETSWNLPRWPSL